MISEGANIYTWWTFTSGVKLANIGLVKKHRGYERTNENGTERGEDKDGGDTESGTYIMRCFGLLN